MTDTFKTPDQPAVQNDQTDVQANDTKILVKRLDDSQDHIKKIHSKLDLQNEVIEKQNKLIEQLLAGAQNLAPAQQDGDGTTSPVLDQSKLLQEVQSAVKSTLQEEKEVERAQQAAAERKRNFDSVSAELTARYGDKVDEVARKIASDNDMSWDEAVAFASNKPKAFLNLFPKESVAPAGTRSSYNSSSLHQGTKKPVVTADPRKLNTLMDRYSQLEAQLTNRG